MVPRSCTSEVFFPRFSTQQTLYILQNPLDHTWNLTSSFPDPHQKKRPHGACRQCHTIADMKKLQQIYQIDDIKISRKKISVSCSAAEKRRNRFRSTSHGRNKVTMPYAATISRNCKIVSHFIVIISVPPFCFSFSSCLTENPDQLQRLIINNNIRLFQFLQNFEEFLFFPHCEIQF